MATVKLNESKFNALMKKLKKIEEEPIDKATAESIGTQVTLMMKKMIKGGIAPILGIGRYAAYKRAGDPKGYPNSVNYKYSSKKPRPVNLELTGHQMDNLDFKAIRKSGSKSFGVEIGYYDKFAALKEQGHREGVGGQPKRPSVPSGKGEEFAKSIQTVIISLINERLKKLTKS